MKLNFEIELDEQKIITDLQTGHYSMTELVKNEIRSEVIRQILGKMDIKTFSDEMTQSFARNTLTKIEELTGKEFDRYLTDEVIAKAVENKIKWRVDNWIEKNMYEYFTKMRDEFVFMRKEDFDSEIENAKE